MVTNEELEREKLVLEIAELKKKKSFSSRFTKGLLVGAGLAIAGNVLGDKS